MKLILAEDTPVLLGQSERWSGKDEDVYGFKRKLVVPFSPRLQFDDGESSSEWTTVAKILSGISWNECIQLRMRNVEDDDIPAANVLHVDGTDGSSELKRLLQLCLGPSREGITDRLVKTQLGNSVVINFSNGTWAGPTDMDDFTRESRNDYRGDTQLTEKQALKLQIAKDKDIRVTHTTSIGTLNPLAFCSRILETGHFSDCEIVSADGEVARCHKVILIESSTKIKKEIEDGSTKLKLELCAYGVQAFLGYLYHGGLDGAKADLELVVELLKVAGSYEVPNLWKKLVGILMEKELDVKVAFVVFEIVVKSGKVESTKDLARKLVAVIHAKSAAVSGNNVVFIEYFKDLAFFTAWFGVLSDVSTTNLEPPTKLARLNN